MGSGKGLKVLGFAGFAWLAASAAAAQESVPPSSPGTSNPSAAPAVVPDDARVVCRSQRFTGSRFPVRTCRTRKEWRDLRENSRRNQERMMDQNPPTKLRPQGDGAPDPAG